jgi:hypothetical protein
MGFWAVWFWLTLVLLFEIFFAKYAAYALGLVLALVLTVAGFLFSAEFDLLAAMLALTYGSVFILLTLLLVQFSSLSGPALRTSPQRLSLGWLLLVFLFFWGVFFVNTTPDLSSWALAVLWQDVLGLGSSEFFQAGMVAHELLYRFFIFETIWANVFLALAFVLYALLLKSRLSSGFGGALKGASGLLASRSWRKR